MLYLVWHNILCYYGNISNDTTIIQTYIYFMQMPIIETKDWYILYHTISQWNIVMDDWILDEKPLSK